MSIERRFISAATAPVRVETREDGKRVIIGYGAVFYNADDPGTEYAMWSDLVERVAPTAFDRALREKDDARGLFNHDPDNLLGRVSAGTMRLSVDSKGLRYEIDAPDTQTGRDVVSMIERGDLTGSSFAFIPKRVIWIEEETRSIRVIEDVELFDTGPVTYPAYEATTTGLRSADCEAVRQERDEWRKERVRAAMAVAVKARAAAVRANEVLTTP